ncbi:DUF4021 domain-containing protein [Pseudalkalibacillus hwajinpoensis]|uniref:DUF4021 domain-containing protein n=1 Tax=Guptibacillus hwajinpoensis TaxID=208199 RepID=UPI00325BA4F0
MDKRTNNKEVIENKKLNKSSNGLGVDQDEQEMNGLYGMLETKQEDRIHDSK